MSLVSIIGPRPQTWFDLEGSFAAQRRLEGAPAHPHGRGPRKDPAPILGGRRRSFQVPVPSTPPAGPEHGAAGPLKEGPRHALASRAEGGPLREGHQHHHPVGDRRAGSGQTFRWPSLLACAAVASSPHPPGAWRTLRSGLVVESGEPRERSITFVLPGPVLRGGGDHPLSRPFETLRADEGRSPAQASTSTRIVKRYIKSIDKGLAEGDVQDGQSPTYQSYCGAQIFRRWSALKSDFVAEYSPARRPAIEGVAPHRDPPRRRVPPAPATPSATRPIYRDALERRRRISVFACAGEDHVWTAATVVGASQHARARANPCRTSNPRLRQGSATSSPSGFSHIRGALFRLKSADEGWPQADPDRGGRAGEGHRAAAFATGGDGRFGSNLARSAYHARDRHEPHRRQGRITGRRAARRARTPLQRPMAKLAIPCRSADQAGGLGAASA